MERYILVKTKTDIAQTTVTVQACDSLENANHVLGIDYSIQCLTWDKGDLIDEFKDLSEGETISLSSDDGVTVTWSIVETEIFLTDTEKRDIYVQTQKDYDIEDIHNLIENGVQGYGAVNPEAIILNDEDINRIQMTFRNRHEWDHAEYTDLIWDINNYLEEPFLASKVNVYFYNKELLNTPCEGFDETQFEMVDTRKELGSLWLNFAKENNLDPSCVTMYSIV